MDNRIEKSILHIAKNFRTELALEDLAKVVGMSKFHFHRLFKAETGLTPLKYINKLKLEHAAHFLTMFPDTKQLGVAFESGYSSPAVFSRAFRKFYKTSLSEYRKEKITKTKRQKTNTSFKLPITYQNRKTLQVYASNLLEKNLSTLYKKLIDKIDTPTNCYGVFIDPPFHKEYLECRYYAGLDNTPKTNTSQMLLEIEEGYYTYFQAQGTTDELAQQIIDYKENFIDSSPYYISSFVGFEKFKLPENTSDFDYFSTVRTLYIKIKRQ